MHDLSTRRRIPGKNCKSDSYFAEHEAMVRQPLTKCHTYRPGAFRTLQITHKERPGLGGAVQMKVIKIGCDHSDMISILGP